MKKLTLVVDDEASFADALAERLQMRGYPTLVAYDAKSAMAIMEKNPPERMVLDLRLPDLDGIDVLRWVKERRPQTRVVVVTGHGSEEDRTLCMDLGAHAFLNKPVKIEDLSRALEGEKLP